jgi:hypothetical protein
VERNRKKRRPPKSVLRLPDLALSKSAVLNVLNSLASQSSHRTYDHAIDEFIEWYCSEPRLSFSRVVVLRYRMHLEQSRYAPSTVNLRLAAIRRLAFEAADTGLLSPDLAAGIARVKGVKRLGTSCHAPSAAPGTCLATRLSQNPKIEGEPFIVAADSKFRGCLEAPIGPLPHHPFLFMATRRLHLRSVRKAGVPAASVQKFTLVHPIVKCDCDTSLFATGLRTQ